MTFFFFYNIEGTLNLIGVVVVVMVVIVVEMAASLSNPKVTGLKLS